MSTINQKRFTNRRDFLGKLAGTAALIGMSNIPLVAAPESLKEIGLSETGLADPDEWFRTNIKGKHKIVFDATVPKEMMTFAWPKVFLMTNVGTGTPEKDCSVVVVLRHDAIAYALEDRLWEKYKFGETFKINDPRTSLPAIRNPFWETKPDDFHVPGIGVVQIGIRDLQASGVLFCVCDIALTVHSAVAGMKSGQDAAVVKKEWLAGLLPSIQPMPSGVWAVGRAQEYGCTYCFAG